MDASNLDFQYDLGKNAINIHKHGVSLFEAENLDWTVVLAAQDPRPYAGEIRYIGYAPLGVRLHCVVYTFRETAIRIISLRKANSREVARYEIAFKAKPSGSADGR